MNEIYNSNGLNALRDEAYRHALNAGFHADGHTEEHYLCLIITELMEAVEADRNNRRCTSDINEIYDTEDDTAFQSIFQERVKDTIEDELADAAIRLLDFAGYMGLTIIKLTKLALSNIFWPDEFTDWAFIAVQCIVGIPKRKTTTGKEIALSEAIIWIYSAAKRLNFDIEKHIMAKMRYNRMRPRMHGKRY